MILKKNKVGFTMVELLGVIVILGIISVISVSSIQEIIAKAKERYYKSQEENMIMAAQSYLENNNKQQHKISGQTSDIKLQTLYSAKYIDKIIDYKKAECSSSNSYVKAIKYENEIYYTPYLECPNYHTNLKKYTSNISILTSFYGDNQEVKNAKVKFEITDSSDGDSERIKGIVSYQYSIYKDGNLVYTSDVFNTKKVTEIEKKLSISKYVPGKIKIMVTATNIYGLTKTKAFTHNYVDSTKPKCIPVSGESTEWSTGTRLITVKCDDGNGSGCKRNTYTYEFTGDVKVGKIAVEDKTGNKAYCDVNVYLDNNPPVVTLTAYKKKAGHIAADGKYMNKISNSKTTPIKSLTIDGDTVNGWLNKDKWPNGVYFELNYSDISSVDKIEWKWNKDNLKKNDSNVNNLVNVTEDTPLNNSGTVKSFIDSDGYRYGEVVITDKLNHESIIKVIVPLDRIKPEMPTSGESTTWINTDREITVNCTDTISECESSPGKHLIKETMQTKTYTIQDKAGNKTTKELNIYVDKIKPSCGTVENSSTKWQKDDREVTIICKDSHSQCKENKTTKMFNTTLATGTITISDQAGNTNDCSVDVYVDKDPPKCDGVVDKVTTWTNKNRTIRQKCADKGSGCEKDVFAKEFTNTVTTGTITIKDNVGYTTDCRADVKIDKIAPICGTKTENNNWINYSTTLKVQCNDSGGSGCEDVKYKVTESMKSKTLTLKDGAGNTTNCELNAYVDKDPPTCGTASGESKKWTAEDRYITMSCNDYDGSGCKENTFGVNFNWTTDKNKITIEDNAGNKENCDVNVYVDKTPPYTPIVNIESAASNTSITGDTCSDKDSFQTSSISCQYTINVPKNDIFHIYWTPLAYDVGSGIDYFMTVYYCEGGKRQSTYTEYLDWTNINSMNDLVASAGSKHCYQKIYSVDKVGHQSQILYYDEYINRY